MCMRAGFVGAIVVYLAAVLVTLFFAEPVYRAPDSVAAVPFCAEPPLCASRNATVKQRLLCAVRSAPLDAASPAYRQYVVTRLRRYVDAGIRGQPVAPSVVERVRYKLAHVHEPMVLHFAGDNGVGKTRVAELISLAMGQRCGDALCSLGETTLVLSGTGYDGMTVGEFRRAVVPVVVQHARRFRHSGVVIINELTSLEPEKVRVLSPLLGRGSSFAEHPAVSVASLLVLLTTDFGREGRTRGKSLAEMQVFISEEFAGLYTKEAASYVRTLPFLPISLTTAGEVVRVVVSEMGCAAPQPLCLTATDAAVLWLVEKTKLLLAAENGRAVALETRLHVETLLAQRADDAAADSGAAPQAGVLPTPPAACPYQPCVISVDGEGALSLQC